MNWRAQSESDVVGEMRAAEWKHGRVLHCATLINDQARRLCSDVDKRGAELFVVFSQRRLSGGELFQHHVGDDQPGAVHRVDGVLSRSYRTRDDVDFYCETRADHTDRIVDAVLVVDDEFLRQSIDDLATGGKLNRARGVDRASDVVGDDLAVASGDGDDGLAVEAEDVRAGKINRHFFRFESA